MGVHSLPIIEEFLDSTSIVVKRICSNIRTSDKAGRESEHLEKTRFNSICEMPL